MYIVHIRAMKMPILFVIGNLIRFKLHETEIHCTLSFRFTFHYIYIENLTEFTYLNYLDAKSCICANLLYYVGKILSVSLLHSIILKGI